jgi:hypothetical protein
MTPQEIQERNKQIALMLGWERHNHASYFTWTKQNSKYHIYDSILQFDSNWNWLMDAVEFIEKLKFNTKACVHCNNDRVYLKTYPLTQTELSPEEEYFAKFISVTNFHFEFCYALKPTKKEAVFIAVSDFAKLYNEKKL